MLAAQPLLGQVTHPPARRREVAAALPLPEQPDAGDGERVPGTDHPRVGVDAELHLARVEPLPDLPRHLALLDVALQRAVGPAPNLHRPAVDLPPLVRDRTNAAAAERPEDQEA